MNDGSIWRKTGLTKVADWGGGSKSEKETKEEGRPVLCVRLEPGLPGSASRTQNTEQSNDEPS